MGFSNLDNGAVLIGNSVGRLNTVDAGQGGQGVVTQSAGLVSNASGGPGGVVIQHLIAGGGGGGTTVSIGGTGGQVYFGNTPTTEPAESMGSLFYRYDLTDPANDTNNTTYNHFYINVGNNTWREFATGKGIIPQRSSTGRRSVHNR